MEIFAGILLLAGQGERFQEDLPKQFHRLSGKKVYIHALEKFVRAGFFSKIILVVHPKYISEVSLETQQYPHVTVIAGGSTRQESSYQALQHCKGLADFVIIHDAVRPFVSEQILQENKEKVLLHSAVDTCTPSFDTIVKCQDGSKIDNIPNRSQCWRGQTPQSFRYDLIMQAHEEAMRAGITDASDDCQLVLRLCKDVFIAKGSEHNIKITTQLDLYIAEHLMRMQETCLSCEDSKSLKEKLYIVVGGSGGIGTALKEELEKEEAKVLVLSRKSSRFPVDIRNHVYLSRVFKRIEREYGPVDGLINAAGILKTGKVEDLDPLEIQEQLFVNLHGVIHACKSASIKQGGHIVNIASSSFARGRAESAIYSAAKAAVVNFTQGLAEECSHLQINTLVPQRTNTQLRRCNFPGEDETTLLDPAKVAGVIVNLLKKEGMTGQIIEVLK